MWKVRVYINLLVVAGNALSMVALFSLSLASFGANVALEVRVNGGGAEVIAT